MKTVAEVWEFESSSGRKMYETLRYTDGSTSCNCPGWTRRVDAAGHRSCKHTRMVDMGSATRQAESHVSYVDPEFNSGAIAKAPSRDENRLAEAIGASIVQKRKIRL